VFHIIEREAKQAKDTAKAEVAELLPFGNTEAARIGDEILCKTSWSKTSSSVAVTDEGVFTAWVKEHHPTEIVETVRSGYVAAAFLEWAKEHHPTEVVETVNPAYVKALKPVGYAVIDAAGEVVPGIDVVAGKPSLSVRAEKNAVDLVARLIAEGRVSLDSVKELTTEPEPVVVNPEVVDVEVVERSDI